MSGKRCISFLVALRPSGEPFAAVVSDGDESTTELTAYELPGATTVMEAVHYACRKHGLVPRALAAAGAEDPLIVVREFDAEMTYKEFCKYVRERMSEIAPELTGSWRDRLRRAHGGGNPHENPGGFTGRRYDTARLRPPGGWHPGSCRSARRPAAWAGGASGRSSSPPRRAAPNRSSYSNRRPSRVRCGSLSRGRRHVRRPALPS